MRALDYKYDWGRPSDSYFTFFTQATEAKEHKDRLASAKSIIIADSPKPLPHLRVNLKKQQVSL
jgi:hypothetical protein